MRRGEPSAKLGKCHFMVNEGLVLGHIVSERGIEVDRAKIEVIENLNPPKTMAPAMGSGIITGRFSKTSHFLHFQPQNHPKTLILSAIFQPQKLSFYRPPTTPLTTPTSIFLTIIKIQTFSSQSPTPIFETHFFNFLPKEQQWSSMDTFFVKANPETDNRKSLKNCKDEKLSQPGMSMKTICIL